MKYVYGAEETAAMNYIDEAAKVALGSNCFRSRCGSVIVKDDSIIGVGFNSPPGNKTIDHCFKDDLPKNFKSDKTCCVHAEKRAIFDALRKNHEKIVGSRIYFVRLDEFGSKLRAGKPYCTMCSKDVLDVGIAEFVLWHKDGVCVYDAEEYNTLSFQYRED
jgi:deoxycytidylate deaminase